MKLGEDVYNTGGTSGVPCLTCHMEDGKGTPAVFPPLQGQKEQMGDCVYQARLIVEGMKGELIVDAITYNGIMPPQANLTDIEILGAITFVRNSFGNDYGVCALDDVKKARLPPAGGEAKKP